MSRLYQHAWLRTGKNVVLVVLLTWNAGPFGRGVAAQSQPGIGIQREPHLVADRDNNLYLVMAAGTAQRPGRPGSQILFTQSTDGGAHWDNTPLTRNLSRSPINGLGALFPRIAVTRAGKTRAYLVYDDDTGGPRQAYCARSTKNTNFKRPALLSSGNDGGFAPVVDVDSAGTVNIAWAESTHGPRQVVFVRSVDQGMTFLPRVNISQSPGEGFDPAIAIGGDDGVNVAWEDTRSGVGETFFSRSTDGGASFSSPRRISAGAGEASDPEVAVDRHGRISVAWIEDQPAGGTRIVISRTTDGGQTFSPPLVVKSDQAAEFEYIAMVAGSGNGNPDAAGSDMIYLAYTDDDAGQVFLTQSGADVLSFSAPFELSHADVSKGHAKSPSIAVDGSGRIHAVWIDTSILGGEAGLLVYRSSTDGRSFTAPILILAVVG